MSCDGFIIMMSHSTSRCPRNVHPCSTLYRMGISTTEPCVGLDSIAHRRRDRRLYLGALPIPVCAKGYLNGYPTIEMLDSALTSVGDNLKISISKRNRYIVSK